VSNVRIPQVRPGFVVVDPKMRRIVEKARRFASFDTPCLLQGETGTGKEVLAEFLHSISRRNDKRFVPIRCGTLPPTLIGAEFLGHTRGAYTGAHTSRPGKVEEANGGTLFLDDVSTLPHEGQTALLAILDRGEAARFGDGGAHFYDVRIISAANESLDDLTKTGRFRLDLLNRLRGVDLVIPPLRERPDDIPALLDYFMVQAASRYALLVPRIPPDTLDLLLSYRWPGNVRELRFLAESLVVESPGREVSPDSLLIRLTREHRIGNEMGSPPYRGRLRHSEFRALFRKEMLRNDGAIREVARKLAISPASASRYARILGFGNSS
jgi:transcriptional regulator with PAS, ATPase and Fis domain